MNHARTKEELFPDEAPCCLDDDPYNHGCCCALEERALRAICSGRYRPMTPAEREWCKQEIIKVEGYEERDAQGDDVVLASTVLTAWRDYCRDKGLL